MLAEATDGAQIRGLVSEPLRNLFAQQGAALPEAPELHDILWGEGIHPQISSEAEALLRDAEDIAPFTENARIYKRGSAPERLAFYALSRLLDRSADHRRQALLADLPTDTGSPLDSLTLSRESAVSLVSVQRWSVLDDAVNEAAEGFRISGKESTTINPGKMFMTTARMAVPFFDSLMLKFARHPSVLRLVGRYLDGYPILYRINLLRSSNEYLQDGSSQFFHLDPEDYRQMKIFILIDDVDEDCGPLHLLAASATDEFRVKTGYRHGRLLDEQVSSVVGTDRLVRCTGARGTMAFGDTSRCLHFGSRPGNRERFVAMIQYMTPFAASYALTPEGISGKYAQPFRDLCEATGASSSVEDRCLYAVDR